MSSKWCTFRRRADGDMDVLPAILAIIGRKTLFSPHCHPNCLGSSQWKCFLHSLYLARSAELKCQRLIISHVQLCIKITTMRSCPKCAELIHGSCLAFNVVHSVQYRRVSISTDPISMVSVNPFMCNPMCTLSGTGHKFKAGRRCWWCWWHA